MQSSITRRLFLAGAFVPGSTAAAQTANWSDQERTNAKVVDDFCAAWSSRNIAKPLTFMSVDCVYRMSETTPPVTGHDGVIQRLKTYVESSDSVQFEVLKTFASGPLVMNHRIDRYISARPLIWEGVGVFFLQNGKIKEWFDYTIQVTR